MFADASLAEAHAPLAIERHMPANPKAGKALLRRLPMEERSGMAQFSRLLGHTELNWRDEIRPTYADPGRGQACTATPNVDALPPPMGKGASGITERKELSAKAIMLI